MKRPSSSTRRKSVADRVVIAGAQFAVVPNDISTNLYRCIYFLRRAVEDTGAKLLVFPESITTGYNPALPIRDLYELLPSTEQMLIPVQKICKELKIHCVLPTYERGRDRGTVYNSAFLIDSRGQNLGVYRKTHLFPTERKANKGWTTPGRLYPVFPTEIGTIGIHICYDGDFPEVSRILAVKGARILCRPSALMRNFEIWEATNKMRAYENHVHHVAVNAIGSDAAHTTYFGHSMIVSPIAQTLALARAVDDLIYAELDPDPFHRISYGSDAPMLFDHLEDRNVAGYTKDLFTPAKVLSPLSRKNAGRK
jgi:beta-ureidopropionase